MTAAVVLRCADVEASRLFYESRLGVIFEREQHEAGPVHYAATLGDLLIELYPADERHPAGETDLMLPRQTDGRGVERDPDGRRILSLK